MSKCGNGLKECVFRLFYFRSAVDFVHIRHDCRDTTKPAKQAECVKIMWECEFPKHYRGIAEGPIGRVGIL